jgi:hypothetical protein
MLNDFFYGFLNLTIAFDQKIPKNIQKYQNKIKPA